MAEAAFNDVRITHRIDTTDAWSANNPVLMLGELGIEIATDATFLAISDDDELSDIDAQSAADDFRACLIKIGDGVTAWNDLPYAHTISADVSAWAKQASKPTYSASEITELDTYIAESPVASNTANGLMSARDKVVLDALSESYVTAPATPTTPGIMSAEDKAKLDSIEAGAKDSSGDVASTSTLGNVMIGTGVFMTGEKINAGVSGAAEGDIPSFNSSGALVSSGVSWSDFTRTRMTLTDSVLYITTV